MKKITAFMISLTILLCMFPLTVFAEGGEEYILFYETDGTCHAVYDSGKTDNTALSGAVYDRASDTLTLTDLSGKNVRLEVYAMGEDFTIKTQGRCELASIEVYGGSLKIMGTGTLTVNADKLYDTAVVLKAEDTAAKLTFDSTVNVNLYGKQNAAAIEYSLCGKDAVAFENGQSSDKVKSERYAYEDTEEILTLLPNIGYEIKDGYSVVSSKDPEGIYAAHIYRYVGENGEYTSDDLYGVSKYIYVDRYDICIRDNAYAVSELTEKEFADSGFSLVTEKSLYAKSIYYYEENDDTCYRAYAVNNPSDPEGIYATEQNFDGTYAGEYNIYRLKYDEESGYYVDEDFALSLSREEFLISDLYYVYDDDSIYPLQIEYNDGGTQSGYRLTKDSDPDGIYCTGVNFFADYSIKSELYRFVYDKNAGVYYKDSSFEPVSLDIFGFNDSGYSYVYDDEPIDFYTGEVYGTMYDIYTDKDGKKYAVDVYGNVYDFIEDDVTELFGITYQYTMLNTDVNLAELTPVTQTVTTDYYNYIIEGTEFVYNANSLKKGDVNGDGKVNIADALMISRYDAGLTGLDSIQLSVSDINGDGKVNIADALMISRFDAGLTNQL